MATADMEYSLNAGNASFGKLKGLQNFRFPHLDLHVLSNIIENMKKYQACVSEILLSANFGEGKVWKEGYCAEMDDF